MRSHSTGGLQDTGSQSPLSPPGASCTSAGKYHYSNLRKALLFFFFFSSYRVLRELSLTVDIFFFCPSESHQHQPVQPPAKQRQHEPLQQHPRPGLLRPLRRRSPAGRQRQLAGGTAASHQPIWLLQGQHRRRWRNFLNEVATDRRRLIETLASARVTLICLLCVSSPRFFTVAGLQHIFAILSGNQLEFSPVFKLQFYPPVVGLTDCSSYLQLINVQKKYDQIKENICIF